MESWTKVLSIALLSAQLASLGFAFPLVRFHGTRVIGTVEASAPNVEAFKGIPFAIPPINENRLRPPSLQTTLARGIFNATQYGPSCLQAPLPGSSSDISEDCLTLNIFRPADQAVEALPVLVYFPGGAFAVGGASRFQGAHFMVDRSIERGSPMILVTANYRLAQLGFPQGNEAAAEGILNLGLKDQIATLKWVKRNVRYFGGNPNNVTIGGVSAAASSIFYHLHQSTAERLAGAAIIQSIAGFPLRSPSIGDSAWADWVSNIPSCAAVAGSSQTLDCLRNVATASEIDDAGRIPNLTYEFLPTVDSGDSILPDFPSHLSLESSMPILVGTNLDEGTTFAPLTITAPQIQPALLGLFSPPSVTPETLRDAVDEALSFYPEDPAQGSPFGTNDETFGLDPAYKRFAASSGDILFNAPTRYLANLNTGAGHPTWVYHFAEQGYAVDPPGVPHGALGVTHGRELLALRLFLDFIITDEPAVNLGLAMQDYWISFVTSGTPNDGRGTTRPQWDTWDNPGPEMMRLDTESWGMVDGQFQQDAIDFMNNNPLIWRR